MLHFFRKFQTYFYVVITFVIVVSFSFFGTNRGMPERSIEDPVAFTAVDGSQIKRSEVEALALFIGSDNHDKMAFGGVWGPNFLNDGVIANDFLETGLATILVKQYAETLRSDWESRLAREKTHVIYQHPFIDFVKADVMWEFHLPEKHRRYRALKNASDPLTPDAIEARVQLYLDERRFTPHQLRHALKTQEHFFGQGTKDPNLDSIDLFAFNHHTVEDWFGPRFTRLVSAFILNSAKVAEQRGYHVSLEEASADLARQADLSFQELSKHINLGVANSQEYAQEHLRRYQMDRRSAAKSWQKVLLFRRLFHDQGQAALLDPLAFSSFNAYAKEAVKGDMYRLPQNLHLGSLGDLEKFEAYLQAVAKPSDDPLALPTQFLSPFEVAKNTPELVQKKYLLEVAEVDKKTLFNKVSVRELWDWQTQDKNWKKLTKEFADLGVKLAKNGEERFAALSELDEKTRARIDTFSMQKIVDEHPEWVASCLSQVEPKEMEVSLSTKGGVCPFKGVENREELIRLLDLAPLKEQSLKLAQFTGDKSAYYQIVVLEKAKAQEVLTFAEAKKARALDKLPKAENIEEVLAAIKKEAKDKYSQEQLTDDLTASLRFYKHIKDNKQKIERNPDLGPEKTKLVDQWKLEKKPFNVERQSKGDTLNKEEAFALKVNSFSTINTLPNGDIYFYFLKEKGVDESLSIDKQVGKAKKLLSDDAQQMLMLSLLKGMQDEHALSLSYLDRKSDD